MISLTRLLVRADRRTEPGSAVDSASGAIPDCLEVPVPLDLRGDEDLMPSMSSFVSFFRLYERHISHVRIDNNFCGTQNFNNPNVSSKSCLQTPCSFLLDRLGTFPLGMRIARIELIICLIHAKGQLGQEHFSKQSSESLSRSSRFKYCRRFGLCRPWHPCFDHSTDEELLLFLWGCYDVGCFTSLWYVVRADKLSY